MRSQDPQTQVFSIIPIAEKGSTIALPTGWEHPRLETIYIFTEGCLACGVVRKRVKQKGVDTVEADDGKGYREQG